MPHESRAASILNRLCSAYELMEEAEILIAGEREVLHACSTETARDICKTATAIANLASTVRWGTIGRGDRAFHDGDTLARGRHENLLRRRSMWKRRVRLLEARLRDATEAGRDNSAACYADMAAAYRAKLAAEYKKEPTLPPAP